ncbi:MAG TPA: hypothetical protein VFZ66_23495 [Herpetosiphonaceae bacterium]
MHTTSTSQRLVARAVLKCGNLGWIWAVLSCPCCGGEHWHSGGPLYGDPYRFVGPDICHVCPGVTELADDLEQTPVIRRSMIYVLEPDGSVAADHVRE